MITRQSSEVAARKLRQIKLLHTAIWAMMAVSILVVPWASWPEHFRWALGLTLLILGECLVLGINHGRCPLTDLAGRYTNDHADNFDIYLPLWLACGSHATTSASLAFCSSSVSLFF